MALARPLPSFASRSRAEVSTLMLRLWFALLAVLVLVIIVVGGATRLTGSGLSITEWNLIGGTIPPLTEAQWQDALAKYRTIPQYQVVNRGMSLEAFKTIFWWEWGHRMLGRLLGLVALIPLTYWSFTGQLRGRMRSRAILIFFGICAQGGLGWWMVKSGLVDRTDVSQYRLMAHLCLAFLLLGLIVWTLADLAAERDDGRVTSVLLDTVSPGQRRLGIALVPLIFLQIALGALVAGMKAGLLYNTWPLFGSEIIPTGLRAMRPFWRNIFENATMVHFNHRALGIVVAGVVLWHVWHVASRADDARLRSTAWVLGILIVVQFSLGVWTILASVPFGLALTHQVVAALLLSAAVWHVHTLVRR